MDVNEMNKVLILQGLIASGKTTYAKTLVKELGYKRVNKDDIRAMVDCGKYSKSNEADVLDIRDTVIDIALRGGRNVVIDDTNFEKKHIDRITEIAKIHDAEVEVKLIELPVTECIKRDLKREHPVGADVILRMYNQYIRKEAENINRLPTAIVCDIDGTLAKMSGRSPFDWGKVKEDRVVKPIRDILQTYANTSGKKIIILSGRDGVCIDDTREWLGDNSVPHDFLYMRSEGDNRPDYIVKEELFRKHIDGKYNVLFVLDDRDQVVDLWRSLGLTCLQCDYGSF